MKIIIKGEVKEVRPGYFRNFLLPKKLAEIATPGKIAELEARKRALQKEREDLKTRAWAELQKIGEGALAVEAETSEKGHLFKGISAKDIAQKLKIPEDWILLERPIKEIGDYKIEIKTPLGDADHVYTLNLSVKAPVASR